MTSQELKQTWDAYFKTRSIELEHKLYNHYYSTSISKIVANKFLQTGGKEAATNSFDREDIMQVADINLLKCIKKYDRSKNISFEAYANFKIYALIIDYLRVNGHKKYQIKKKILVSNSSNLEKYLPENVEVFDTVCSFSDSTTNFVESVSHLLHYLPPLYKRVFILKAIKNHTLKEVAKLEGIKYRKTMRIYELAKKSLKEKIKKERI